MKKRIISLLLAVLTIASMFSVIGVSAYADNADEYEWTEVTVKSGQNVYGICQSLKIDFYANKALISAVNNITNYNNIPVGKVIRLPKKDVDYSGYLKSSTGSSSASSSSAAPASSVVPSSTGKVTVPTSDYLAYYLVSYTMKAGDTVYDVCRSLGISFNSYSEMIKSLNKISSYSGIAAGKTLLLPASSVPAGATAVSKVMAHKVNSGETVGKIMGAYSMDYNSNADSLKVLNNSSNLDKIKAGQIFYVGIPAGTSTGSGSGTGTGSGTGSGTGTGTGTGTDKPAAKTYDITLAKATNGSFTVSVGGKAATKAEEGASVTVKASPNSGCSVDAITVTKTSNGASVAVDKDGCFVMPGCAVTVNVTFTAKHKITFTNHGKGEASALVNGSSVTSAKKGQSVGIKTSAEKDYCVTKIVVTNKKTGAQIPFSDGKFVMPDNDVTVDAYFEKSSAKSYSLRHDTGKGSFETMVDNIAVNRAEVGKEVYILPLAGSGKEISTISYTRLDNNLVYKLTNTDHFTMPAANVAVSVTFKNKTAYAINIPAVTGGSAVAQVNGKTVTTAVSGATVTIVPTAKDGYKLTKALFNSTDITEELSFTMPEKKANIELTFEKTVIPTYTITDTTAAADKHGTVKITVDGKEADKAAESALIELEIKPDTGYKVSGIEVYAGGKMLSKYTEGSSSFFMPDANVEFKVSYASASFTVDTVQSAHGTFTAKVGGSTVTTAAAGKQVDITYKLEKGYVLDNAYVTVLEDGEEKVMYDKSIIRSDKSVYFQMPSSDVVVYLTFVAEKENKVTCDANVTLSVDGDAVASGDIVSYGDVVKVSPVSSSIIGKKYDITVKADGNVIAQSHNDSVIFNMPQANVEISFAASANTLNLVVSKAPSSTAVPHYVALNKDMVTVQDGYFAPNSDTAVDITPGAWVVVEPYFCPHGSGWMYEIVVKDGNGKKIASNTEKGVNFKMPANGATVTVKYYQ